LELAAIAMAFDDEDDDLLKKGMPDDVDRLPCPLKRESEGTIKPPSPSARGSGFFASPGLFWSVDSLVATFDIFKPPYPMPSPADTAPKSST